ncbi:uncharacterized protein HRG_08371 [Hirsutella rhossiliensis]|uniref:DUF1264-domain-containing protein n=1 Tax=Hirsutella rhossiliensis TaxID=111463 RepID=A0A9P8SGR2_9HYPO|nr:uncharacterized protein HRG_08371 [Hirsutella rhossiliensis]KAH0960216.1 hypothetical protein HRG_08371 [Hirsutella rhossiliensis]
MSQDFKPIKNICAHLNAFHAYASEPSRSVEANHYCGHVNDDVRQCLLYDSAEANAQRRLWHSHVYEVKSGMLIMPNPSVPDSAWELGEKKEMEQIITLYGKVYHLWQTDKGHKVPLGEPQLMTSYTADGQLDFAKVEERDARFGTDYQRKQEARRDIPLPEIHPDADASWKIA